MPGRPPTERRVVSGQGIPQMHEVDGVILQVGIQRGNPIPRAARIPATVAADWPSRRGQSEPPYFRIGGTSVLTGLAGFGRSNRR